MINISIDVKKISKDRLKAHSNGANYLSLTVDKLKEVDKFGNTHCVYESQTKEERERKDKRNYIGNGKEFVFGGQQSAKESQQTQNYTPPLATTQPFEDLPF